jgi:hypothetical protein
MKIVLLLVPLAMVLALYAVYIKLSARLLRRSKVSWKNSFLFALVLILLAFAGRAGSLALGQSLPLLPGLIFGLTAQVILGGWFFSTRGTDAAGQPLGWRGGIQLSVLAFLLMAVTGFVLFGVVHVLSPAQL